VVLSEMPGITPNVAAFAQRVVDAGFTVAMPVLFGEPGHLYVYLVYGMHHCANVVCGPRGTASAVLLRAAAVEGGAAAVWDRRGLTVAAARLLSGPGNLCRGLAIGGADNGADLCQGGRLCLEGAPDAPPLSSGPRVGISRAAERQLRFWWAGHPAVSAASRAGTKKGTGAEAGPEKSADLSRPPGA